MSDSQIDPAEQLVRLQIAREVVAGLVPSIQVAAHKLADEEYRLRLAENMGALGVLTDIDARLNALKNPEAVT